MNLKHLRYFLAVAEERSFTHAANRVHIEPSPLSRAIKELETRMGVRLLRRVKGRVQLTGPGKALEEEARRIMTQIEHAKSRVHSASKGFQMQLRIGLTDGLASPRLAQLLALSREEQPTTEIRIHDMTLSELHRALRHGQIDAGFTVDTRGNPEDIAMIKLWQEHPAVALPILHPLLAYEKVPLHEALHYPLITYHPERCAGGYRTMKRWLGRMARGRALNIAEHVSNHEQMVVLVAAGYGIAFGLESQFSLYRHPHVIVRPVEDETDTATFMAIPEGDISQELTQFIQRAQVIGDSKNAGKCNGYS
jgi:DNA-binding transcriptional LysR family regulator